MGHYFQNVKGHAWTKPYHGVTHLENGSGTGWQITVSDYGKFALAILMDLRSDTPFTGAKEMQFSTVAEAKAQGEAWAVEYSVYTKRPRG